MHPMVLLTSFLLVLLAGCETLIPPRATMSPAAAKVQVHTQLSNFLDTCKKLGPVSSTFKLRPFVDSGPFLEAAVREATTNLGGDSLVLVHLDESAGTKTLHGIAFRCY